MSRIAAAQWIEDSVQAALTDLLIDTRERNHENQRNEPDGSRPVLRSVNRRHTLHIEIAPDAVGRSAGTATAPERVA